MKRFTFILLLFTLLVGSLVGCQQKDPNPVVTMEMAAGGTIKIELYPEAAPNTVSNFIDLVKKGFYDGLSFHRIMPGFVVQGGCPEGTGMGGPGHTIKGEFTANGFKNNLKHTRGVISMARSQAYDSAGSQFFIMHRDNANLDGNYAAFGKVISGMDIVDRIAQAPADDKAEGLALEPREVMKKVTVDTFGRTIEAPQVTKKAAPVVWNGPKPVVTIEMAAGGAIKIELYPHVAPNTVNNFIDLVQKGFYNGLVFHRIIPGFMIQGGCPQGSGMGGPGYGIKGEFTANGFPNDLSHTRGVISMARSQANDSAGSQFFIMHKDSLGLDGSYTAFGKVISGMEVVDRIVMGPSNQADNGKALEPREVMKKVTVDTFGVKFDPPQTVKR